MAEKPRKLYCVKQPQWYLSGRAAYRKKHKCDLGCMQLVRQILSEKKDKFCQILDVPGVLSSHHSSYLVPLQLGFGRVLDPTGNCHYQAPCGRPLHSYSEIFAFLKVTDCCLSVDQFVLDSQIPLFRAHLPLRVWYYLPDLSRGKECLAVQAVNEYSISALPDFEYVQGMRFEGDSGHLKEQISSELTGDKVCCDCRDNCEDSEKCACQVKSRFGYDFMRLGPSPPPLYVCYFAIKKSVNFSR
jgi:hypothetical protein